MTGVVRIKPYHYVHIFDANTYITRVVSGPLTFMTFEHEKVIAGPSPMVIIPPRHYCIISNPVHKDAEGKVELDDDGNVRLRRGDEEIRFEQAPFPLYPGEALRGKVQVLQVVPPHTALRLRALRDANIEKIDRKAGDEWLWKGPGTYYPHIHIQVMEIVKATVIKPNFALRLQARRAMTDADGHRRVAGEEWIYKHLGTYLPAVEETVLGLVRAEVLTDKRAMHLRAKLSFTDVYGNFHTAGSDWLVTNADAETHIPSIEEEIVGFVNVTVLTKQQYCVVVDPYQWVQDKHSSSSDERVFCQQLGKKEQRRGPLSFFLRPGERLEGAVQTSQVLIDEEALLLRAKETYVDVDHANTVRQPGHRWMVYGPCEYIPPIEVEVLERRRNIPLDENEGIYVRNILSGLIRVVTGKTYSLRADEELWAKPISRDLEELLFPTTSVLAAAKRRDPYRVVSFRAQRNTAVQIHDYRSHKSRVVFGPELVMLGPDEEITVLNLSGDTPKRPKMVPVIALLLGPDFMTDVVTVETADHARLSLKLAYNWRFRVDAEQPGKLFAVPDFVGDACKAIAARVRGAVAHNSFDEFHRFSAKIIREAVFGSGGADTLEFAVNGLLVQNVDIQSVEPIDQRTRDSLQKSVQLAIEITTASQEAAARHEAQVLEQSARGRLERQKFRDDAEAERGHRQLLELRAQSAVIESVGMSIAEAKGVVEGILIEGASQVAQAKLIAETKKVLGDAELDRNEKRFNVEMKHLALQDELELLRAREMAAIEAKRFKEMVAAIGPDTIAKVATSSTEIQAKLLKGLGVRTLLVTDGNSPINLLNSARLLVATNN